MNGLIPGNIKDKTGTNCSLTAHEGTTNPWWGIYLENIYRIHQIIIYARADRLYSHLNGLKYLIVTNETTDTEKLNFENYKNENDNWDGVNITQDFDGTGPVVINVDNLEGNIIFLYLEGTEKILSLCNVEIYGKEITSEMQADIDKDAEYETYLQGLKEDLKEIESTNNDVEATTAAEEKTRQLNELINEWKKNEQNAKRAEKQSQKNKNQGNCRNTNYESYECQQIKNMLEIKQTILLENKKIEEDMKRIVPPDNTKDLWKILNDANLAKPYDEDMLDYGQSELYDQGCPIGWEVVDGTRYDIFQSDAGSLDSKDNFTIEKCEKWCNDNNTGNQNKCLAFSWEESGSYDGIPTGMCMLQNNPEPNEKWRNNQKGLFCKRLESAEESEIQYEEEKDTAEAKVDDDDDLLKTNIQEGEWTTVGSDGKQPLFGYWFAH